METIKKQIAAIVDKAGIFFEVVAKSVNKTLSKKIARYEIEKFIPWLERMNSRKYDLYIRHYDPKDKSRFVILSGLSAEALARMKTDSITPCAVLETRRNTYQAWIKISDDHVSDETRKAIAHDLMTKYGGMVTSHCRLAGFANWQADDHVITLQEANEARVPEPIKIAVERLERRDQRDLAEDRHAAQQRQLRYSDDGPGLEF